MAKLRILVVDSHAVFRRQVCDLLSLYDDIEVVGQAADGREAIEKARELAPDVVVMDIAMPLINGLGACRHIHKESPKTRVIILSDYDNSAYVSASIEAGATGFVAKGAVDSQLISAIRTVHRGDYFLHPP